MKEKSIFNREGSTLGVMDDLQVAVHTYDGCSRGCPGCVVDKHFKNQGRGQPILHENQMRMIDSRVREYYEWAKSHLNNKESGYFGKNGFNINHYSYTFRFGNHSELPFDELVKISNLMNAPFKVFSTAPTEEVEKFVRVRSFSEGKFFLEIIYDPVADKAEYIREMILEMRKHDIKGYPEVLITQRLLEKYTPERFVDECVAPLGDIGTQMQFGRYTPSKTRNFNTKQIVSVDTEVEWLAAVAKIIVDKNLNIHPIPIAEYAVTLLDEYGEHLIQNKAGEVEEARLSSLEEEPFNAQSVAEKTKDIFLSSLYIDHNLDVFVWSESMGQHVLDKNFGFSPLGNITKNSLEEIVQGPQMTKMVNSTIRHLVSHVKCSGCRYKSFCASHAIPFFRHFQPDNGKHCYGYLPVIREFQKDKKFLINMIDGFKELEF